MVTINKDGELFLKKEQVAGPLLMARLEGMSPEQKKEPIYLHADRAVPYRAVMGALSVIHRAGFEKPCMVTLPDEEKGR